MELFQIYHFIIKPTLRYLEMDGPAARRLLLATIAHESKGKHIDQRLSSSDTTLGPAYGLYQIEAGTHHSLYEDYLKYHPRTRTKLDVLAAGWPSPLIQCATNLVYATAVARLIYYKVPRELPEPDDLEGLWWYYKYNWNTLQGKAKKEDWFYTYDKMVLPVFDDLLER